MPSCSILGCKNRSRNENVAKGGISYHKFPTGPDHVLKKWIEATGRKNWVPTKHSVVCSCHFSNTYLKTEKLHRFLGRNAIPTENVFHKTSQDTTNDTSPVKKKVLAPVLIKAETKKALTKKRIPSTDEFEIPISSTIELRVDPLSDYLVPYIKEEEDDSVPPGTQCVVQQHIPGLIKEEPALSQQKITASNPVATKTTIVPDFASDVEESSDVTDVLKFESRNNLERELKRRVLRERKLIKMIKALKHQNLRLKEQVALLKDNQGSQL